MALLPWLTAPLAAAAGWVVQGRRRQITTESSALDLYKDSLTVLSNTQDVVNTISAEHERMRRELALCVQARRGADMERANDRVVIAELQRSRVENSQKIERLEAEVLRLTAGGVV